MTFSNSDRCVFFTASPYDRELARVKREFDRRTQLLETLREINRSEVHPKNRNYCGNFVTSEVYLARWAIHSGLATVTEVLGLMSEQHNKMPIKRLY